MGDCFDQEDLVSGDVVIPSQRQRPDLEQLDAGGLATQLASGAIDELELADGSGAPWSVRCCSQRYAILTRAVGMPPTTHVIYTVIDWRQAVVGPCNLIGGQWRDGTYSDQDCQLMLAALAGGVITVNRSLSAPLQILRTTSRSHP